MGLLAWLFRRKQAPGQMLEEMEERIAEATEHMTTLRQRQWWWAGSVKLYGVVGFLLGLVLLFGGFLPAGEANAPWIRFVFVFGYPVVGFLLMKLLHLYFRRRIHTADQRLQVLQTEKEKKMDHIKKNLSYDAAKPLIEKYGTPKQDVRSSPQVQMPNVRQRATPSGPSPSVALAGSAARGASSQHGAVAMNATPRTPSVLDNFVGMVVGDESSEAKVARLQQEMEELKRELHQRNHYIQVLEERFRINDRLQQLGTTRVSPTTSTPSSTSSATSSESAAETAAAAAAETAPAPQNDKPTSAGTGGANVNGGPAEKAPAPDTA